jgi:hypothetical protein
MTQLQYLVEQTKPLNVSREKNKLVLEGFMLSSKINNNMRRYDLDNVLSPAVQKIQHRIRENSFFGAISHGDGSNVPLDRASHIVTSLTRRGDGYWGVARVLTGTPSGNILASICEHSGKIGMSAAGYGLKFLELTITS